MDTRIWIPPTLCGCEFQITADWASDPVTDEQGRQVMYQHPKGRQFIPASNAMSWVGKKWVNNNSKDTYNSFVGSVVCTNRCADHQTTPDLEDDPHFGCPGYIDFTNPTYDEKLYIYFFRYTSLVHKPDTCDCVLHHLTSRADQSDTITPHPLHSQKCSDHFDDDDNGTQAMADNQNKNAAVNAVLDSYPDLTPADVEWEFDADRNVTVSSPKLSDTDNANLMTVVKTALAKKTTLNTAK